MQQCASTSVHVLAKPDLRVDPPSATIYRGESIRLRCISPGSDRSNSGTLGYSWTRNNALFQSDPDAEMWEDLYPDGSILKIHSIQVNYTTTAAIYRKCLFILIYLYICVYRNRQITRAYQ